MEVAPICAIQETFMRVVNSLRNAINDKCRDCIYDPLAGGTWRAQVEMCTVTRCPLYPVRPVTEATREHRAKMRAMERNGSDE